MKYFIKELWSTIFATTKQKEKIATLEPFMVDVEIDYSFTRGFTRGGVK